MLLVVFVIDVILSFDQKSLYNDLNTVCIFLFLINIYFNYIRLKNIKNHKNMNE